MGNSGIDNRRTTPQGMLTSPIPSNRKAVGFLSQANSGSFLQLPQSKTSTCLANAPMECPSLPPTMQSMLETPIKTTARQAIIDSASGDKNEMPELPFA